MCPSSAAPPPREYLAEVRRCARRIPSLERELAVLRECGETGASWDVRDHSGGGRGSCTASDPTATAAEALIERLPRRMAEVSGELRECKRVVGGFRAALDEMSRDIGERYATVLRLYWIDGAATWSEIAAEAGIPTSTVRWRRDRAYEWMGEHGVG